eukprot:756522-Hanusia_phi.AAC.3
MLCWLWDMEQKEALPTGRSRTAGQEEQRGGECGKLKFLSRGFGWGDNGYFKIQRGYQLISPAVSSSSCTPSFLPKLLLLLIVDVPPPFKLPLLPPPGRCVNLCSTCTAAVSTLLLLLPALSYSPARASPPQPVASASSPHCSAGNNMCGISVCASFPITSDK